MSVTEAVRIEVQGAPAVMRVARVDLPAPGPGEVLVTRSTLATDIAAHEDLEAGRTSGQSIIVP